MSEIQPRHSSIESDLLRTKLAPPRLAQRAALVPRASLFARLDGGLARKLTLVSAPTGCGKTTLVAQWLVARSDPAAWVLLDAGDNDPIRFWRYVVTACRAFDGTLGKSSLALLRSAQPTLEVALTAFINELAQLAGQYILVLEDYHTITSQQVHETMTFLLDHLPPTLHLVLMTRSEPPLPLARLRASNQLNELGADDLRFSSEEIQAFFQRVTGLPLSIESVARLETRTEGWAAGLRLAALATEGKRDASAIEQFLASFSGRHRHVIEYLTAEVLATQPEPMQEFLLRTSILDRLTASLCDAVTDRNDSADLLAQLERANLFVLPLGDSGQAWYRYHALFAEAMRHAARERFGEESVRALYTRASAWYEAQGLLNEAIETAIVARQYPHAATLVEQSLDLRSQRELYTFRHWVEQIPQEVLEAHPTLCFEYAITVLFTSDRFAAATATWLEKPLQVAEETWRREENDAGLSQVLALRALVALWQGDFARAFSLAHESLQLLPEHDVFWRGSDLIIVGIEESLAGRMDTAQNALIEARALSGAAQNIHGQLAAAGLLADVYDRQGEFDQAIQLYQQIQAEAVGSEDMLDDQASASLGLSRIAYERNDLDTAEREATRALELGAQRSNDQLAVHAALMLVRMLYTRGKLSEAQEKLRSLVAQTKHPRLIQEVLAWQARFALAARDMDAVHRWHAAAQRAQDLPLTMQEQQDLIAARMLMADEEFPAALELLERWQMDARQHGRTSSELETVTLKALVYAAQPNKAQAGKSLVRALTLGQSKGYQRVFLDEGEPMRSVIGDRRLEIEKQAPRLRDYVAKLLAAFSSQKSETGNQKSEILVEPLSPQEQRVLRLLAAGLSNPEIARELVVSINTIKTQVQSIYRKLNVSNRDQARDVARELELV